MEIKLSNILPDPTRGVFLNRAAKEFEIKFHLWFSNSWLSYILWVKHGRDKQYISLCVRSHIISHKGLFQTFDWLWCLFGVKMPLYVVFACVFRYNINSIYYKGPSSLRSYASSFQYRTMIICCFIIAWLYLVQYFA